MQLFAMSIIHRHPFSQCLYQCIVLNMYLSYKQKYIYIYTYNVQTLKSLRKKHSGLKHFLREIFYIATIPVEASTGIELNMFHFEVKHIQFNPTHTHLIFRLIVIFHTLQSSNTSYQQPSRSLTVNAVPKLLSRSVLSILY